MTTATTTRYKGFFRSDAFDRAITWAVWILFVAVLGVGAWLGYTVYQDRIQEQMSTPSGRTIAAIKEQIRANPNDADLRVRLGEAYASIQMYDDALESFGYALEIDDQHVGAYLDIGIVSLAMEEVSRAESAFQKVLELTAGWEYAFLDNRREQAFFYLGRIAVSQERWEEAVGFLKESLRIRRDASDTYLELARAYFGLDETGRAIETVRIALAFDPNFAEARYELGTFYLAEGNETSAAIEFRYAADIVPDADPVLEAIAALGQAEERLGRANDALASEDFKAAADEATIASAIDPDLVEAYLLLGEALEGLGRRADALAAYRTALEHDSENPRALAAVTRLSGQ